ncbi:Branched-chain amino acid transport ATP-binding protein LivF (TC 3.A.1.4.1) [plant metagenome]|uniref:Branched-chain amino acid transport ATP-binding protein LivF (TC 3.A.1.4.1) n=1 Tax=plant metagenome TaxID=1297885 RepID=A0A484NVL1_9ZZZZ
MTAAHAGVLTVRGLAAGYGPQRVLRDLSLAVPRGAVACLLGPNGAGKTTLLRTVVGAIGAARGSIRYAGRDGGGDIELGGRPPAAIVALGVALVPQHRMVFPSLSVRDNLLAGASQRRDRQGIGADLQRMLVRYPALAERQRQRAGTLSGGEQQMLAIARALMSRPALLLMDEPSQGLAPRRVQELSAWLRELAGEGMGILLAEQNVVFASAVADRSYLLQDGKALRLDRGDAGRQDARAAVAGWWEAGAGLPVSAPDAREGG